MPNSGHERLHPGGDLLGHGLAIGAGLELLKLEPGRMEPVGGGRRCRLGILHRLAQQCCGGVIELAGSEQLGQVGLRVRGCLLLLG